MTLNKIYTEVFSVYLVEQIISKILHYSSLPRYVFLNESKYHEFCTDFLLSQEAAEESFSFSILSPTTACDLGHT